MALDPERAARMLAYLDRVLAINLELNLTAVRDREDAVVRHLCDSLSVVPAWREVSGRAAPRRFLDLGTGGGFPGAVLAAAWPTSRGLLVDRTGKKVRAVADALAVAGIVNAETLHARGFELPGQRPDSKRGFDLCVARAVGDAGALVRELAPLVARDGFIFLMKGPEPPQEEVAAGEREAKRARLRPLPLRTTSVQGLEARTLLVYGG